MTKKGENGVKSNQSSKMDKDQNKAPSRKKRLCSALGSMLKLTKEGATPVNWKAVTITVLTLFASCYSITFLFPFLPEMVLWFGYKEEEKGYYAGIIASAMFAGRAAGSYFWGWLSDKIGRRPVVLILLVGLAASNIAFGFSTGIVFAFVTRFTTGLFNGLVSVLKAVLYETSDNTNQAVGMSFIGYAWGLGIVVGPLVSGYLANPAVRYPNTFAADGFFGDFPFMLPSLISAAIAAIVLVIDIFIFPETLESKKKKEVNEKKDEELGDKSDPEKTESGAKNKHLLRPNSVDICASMMSLDVQLTRPLCHLSQPSTNMNPLVHRTLSDTGGRGRKSLYKAHSTDMLHSKGKGDKPENYPLTKRRTSVSMHHIPSSNLLKELANQNSTQDIQEEEMTDKAPQNSRDNSLSTKNNPECYLKENGSCNHTTETTAMLYEPAKEKPTISPQISIVVQGEASETEHCGSVLEDEVQIRGEKKKQSGCLKACLKFKVVQLWRIADVQYTMWLYTVLSFGVIGLEEVFTVWTSTDVQLDGLGFSSEKIGAVIGFPSIPLMLLQVIIYPKIANAIGNIKTFQLFNLYLILATPLLPTLRALHDKNTALWVMLIVLQGIQKVAFTSCFTSASLLLNNSVDPRLAGTVNGLSMTMAALARTLAPTVGGSIFAWSITHGRLIGFPFDVNLVFIVFGVVFLGSNVLSVFMPRSLENQKKPQAVDSDKLQAVDGDKPQAVDGDKVHAVDGDKPQAVDGYKTQVEDGEK